jgi:hypothetical protein
MLTQNRATEILQEYGLKWDEKLWRPDLQQANDYHGKVERGITLNAESLFRNYVAQFVQEREAEDNEAEAFEEWSYGRDDE